MSARCNALPVYCEPCMNLFCGPGSCLQNATGPFSNAHGHTMTGDAQTPDTCVVFVGVLGSYV
eukprot:10007970-Alexandrium_andersonii.AAC.1